LLVLTAIAAGCAANIKSSTGTVYPSGTGAQDAALVDSARADLPCGTEPIAVRHISLYHSDQVHVADGCGMRAIYLLHCPTAWETAHAPGRDDAPRTQNRSELDAPTCEFVLISRVQLLPPPPS
jgi:hypothetical protein